MTEQDEIIHDIISTLPKELEERAINKVVGDMLVNCMDRITSQSAFELMQLGEYAELRPEHHQLLEWDRNQFKTGKEIQFNQRHMEIFEEVMQAQKVAQQAYEEKMMENLEHHQALQTHDAEEVMSYA